MRMKPSTAGIEAILIVLMRPKLSIMYPHTSDAMGTIRTMMEATRLVCAFVTSIPLPGASSCGTSTAEYDREIPTTM